MHNSEDTYRAVPTRHVTFSEKSHVKTAGYSTPAVNGYTGTSSIKSNKKEKDQVCISLASQLRLVNVHPAVVVAHCSELDRNGDGLISIVDLEEVLNEALYPAGVSRRAVERLGAILLTEYTPPEELEKLLVSTGILSGGAKDGLDLYGGIKGAVSVSRNDVVAAVRQCRVIPYRYIVDALSDTTEEDDRRNRAPPPGLGLNVGAPRADRMESRGALQQDLYDDVELRVHSATKHVTKKNPSGMTGSVGEWLVSHGSPAEAQNHRRLVQCLEQYERLSGLRCLPTPDGFVIPLGPELRASLSFFTHDRDDQTPGVAANGMPRYR